MIRWHMCVAGGAQALLEHHLRTEQRTDLGAVLPILLLGHDPCRDPSVKPHFGLEKLRGLLLQRRGWI